MVVPTLDTVRLSYLVDLLTPLQVRFQPQPTLVTKSNIFL